MKEPNGNRLAIPELENQIALLELELRRRTQPARAHGMYVCTDCRLLYQSVWGCGCVTKHLRGQVPPSIAQGGDGSPLGSGARPDQPKLPESGGGSSIVLGAEGEQ